MTRTCTVCRSPAVDQIDQGLVAGSSCRSLAAVASVSRMAIWRHKQHFIERYADRFIARHGYDGFARAVAPFFAINLTGTPADTERSAVSPAELDRMAVDCGLRVPHRPRGQAVYRYSVRRDRREQG